MLKESQRRTIFNSVLSQSHKQTYVQEKSTRVKSSSIWQSILSFNGQTINIKGNFKFSDDFELELSASPALAIDEHGDTEIMFPSKDGESKHRPGGVINPKPASFM
jgi:hypothetical protein